MASCTVALGTRPGAEIGVVLVAATPASAGLAAGSKIRIHVRLTEAQLGGARAVVDHHSRALRGVHPDKKYGPPSNDVGYWHTQ
eukprot:scaffold2668_cov319-Prasinococcus_capsulatus_cf.AAC.12